MDILALSHLLQDSSTKENHENGTRREEKKTNLITPASFGPPKSGLKEKQFLNDENDNEIWRPDEIPDSNTIHEEPNDDRPQPTYEVYFKQIVGTEDVFLGTEKTPGSSDCTHIVVKIHFPGCELKVLKLDVKTNQLYAESPDRKLSLYLPQPVDEENGNAQWESDEKILIVTLPIAHVGW